VNNSLNKYQKYRGEEHGNIAEKEGDIGDEEAREEKAKTKKRGGRTWQ